MDYKTKLSLILSLIEQFWDLCSDANDMSFQLIADIEKIIRFGESEE